MKKYLAGVLVLLAGITILWLSQRQGFIPIANNMEKSTPVSRRDFDIKTDTRIAVNPPLTGIVPKTSINQRDTISMLPEQKNEPVDNKVNNAKDTPFKPAESIRPMPLWRQWRARLEKADYQQLPIIGSRLSRALQQQSDTGVYDEIAGLLWQPEIPVDKRALILDLLSEIATPEALSQLLTLTEQGVESELYLQVLQAIARISDFHWQGRYHHELSPVLLTAWSGSKRQDAAFYDAVGNALAGVGDPDAVNNLLLSVSGNTAGENDQIDLIKQIKQQAAFKAIPKISNPEAVEVLGAWFAQEQVGAPAFEVSGTALAEIGTRQAVRIILSWAKFAPAQGARNLQEWLALIDDSDTFLAIASRDKPTFQSREVEAVYHQFSVAATSTGSPSLAPGTADGGIGITGTPVSP